MPTTRNRPRPQRRAQAEIHRQHIGLHDLQTSAALQTCRQIPVEFDHAHLPHTLQQGLRQGSQAGADFHQGLAWSRVDGTHNAVNDGQVRQEVLAEALARNVFHQPVSAVAYCGGSRNST